MNIKDLEYFQVICQEKSITRAAKRMYLSPQGLSRILQNMENELNTTLLIRTKSGIRLTESGDALLMHAGEILQSYGEMEQIRRSGSFVCIWDPEAFDSGMSVSVPGKVSEYYIDLPRVS